MKSILSGMWVALVVGLVCILAGAANAQDEGSEAPALSKLKVVDSDSDGVVTLDELKTYLLENHIDDWSAKVETGDVTDGQREKLFVEKYLDAWVEKIDGNENGKISKWELRTAFKSLDRVIVEVGEDAARKSEEAANRPPQSSVEMMDLRFQSRKPTLGSRVENLVGMGEDGEEVDFAELRDKHVVIVFGCLT